MDATNNPELVSFIPVASTSHFPIQNLPYGVFRPRSERAARIGVAIGDYVLDLAVLADRGHFKNAKVEQPPVFARPTLNDFMALGREVWRDIRSTVSHLLSADVTTLRDDPQLRRESLWPLEQVELLLPACIGDYTDFYSSREHATNVGALLRGADQALLPNWLHLPVAYHGRASSIVLSGTDVRRPHGQTRGDGSEQPAFGPSRAVDFELEMGFLIGPGNQLGDPIPARHAEEQIFGLVLVNDWSARDIQRWEYQPLGPFLSKNFATSISPWVVPLDALEPFRTTGPSQVPPPLPYLQTDSKTTFDIQLEVWLQTRQMRSPERVCSSNFRHLYWSMAQQIAHHTVNGCNLRPGDLLASGTISGPRPDALGCLLELTAGGAQPIVLPDGERRQFLEDHDRVIMTAWCQGPDYRVGFGELSGTLLPGKPLVG